MCYGSFSCQTVNFLIPSISSVYCLQGPHQIKWQPTSVVVHNCLFLFQQSNPNLSIMTSLTGHFIIQIDQRTPLSYDMLCVFRVTTGQDYNGADKDDVRSCKTYRTATPLCCSNWVLFHAGFKTECYLSPSELHREMK